MEDRTSMGQARRKPTLLIVDDERRFAESLQLAIEDEFVVFAAHSLRTAREILKCISPAAVLLDVRLPDGHGLDLLGEIQRSEAPTVVVIMTAYSTVETFISATNLGASDYVTKPLNIDQLREILHTRLTMPASPAAKVRYT